MTPIEIMFYYIVFLIVVTARISTATDELDDMKTKRGAGTVGLFPFPRVGRSDPEMIDWNDVNAMASNSFEDYGDNFPMDLPRMEVKRQGLIPFPRVGRSGQVPRYLSKSAYGLVKRGGPGANGGMWFGPRLGRIQKRNADDSDDQLQGDRL